MFILFVPVLFLDLIQFSVHNQDIYSPTQTYLVGICRNAGDAIHTEVKTTLERETCFLHKDNEKAS